MASPYTFTPRRQRALLRAAQISALKRRGTGRLRAHLSSPHPASKNLPGNKTISRGAVYRNRAIVGAAVVGSVAVTVAGQRTAQKARGTRIHPYYGTTRKRRRQNRLAENHLWQTGHSGRYFSTYTDPRRAPTTGFKAKRGPGRPLHSPKALTGRKIGSMV
jgi:hypothetical protein